MEWRLNEPHKSRFLMLGWATGEGKPSTVWMEVMTLRERSANVGDQNQAALAFPEPGAMQGRGWGARMAWGAAKELNCFFPR